MNAERGPELLSKRALISSIKRRDDLDADGEAKGAEFLELETRLNDEKLNYTDEQWALLTQIANYESAYSASVELAMAGDSDDPEYKKRQTLREQEKR